MPPIRLLQVGGSYYDMGYQHGQAYADQIRELTEERIHLSTDSAWVGRNVSREAVMELAYLCLQEHRLYAPELVEELQGISDATGISLPELIVTNGFTDFVDAVYNFDPVPVAVPVSRGNECTAFLVSGDMTIAEHGLLGQTWDMHETAMPYVILMRGEPEDGPRFLVFTVTGCVGMIGMNSAGIAVGINNLMSADGQVGVMWPFVVRKILQQTNLDDALDCILSARLAGGHNYLITDKHGRGYNVEAMPTVSHVTEINALTYAHANQCLHESTQEVERDRTEAMIDDSSTRRNRANLLLQQRPLTPQILMQMTRDRSDGSYSICSLSEEPFYSATLGAAVMRPATGEFWGVWGLPNENEYERFLV
jgi:isopenicillin-N N-acyltransferase like protein